MTYVVVMIWFRIAVALSAAFLSGCSLPFDRSDILPNPMPDANQQKAIDIQIAKNVSGMKGAKGLGISEAGRNAAQSGPEQWTVCARVDFVPKPLYYTYFVRADKVVESRPSVLNDDCESRVFRPARISNTSSIY